TPTALPSSVLHPEQDSDHKSRQESYCCGNQQRLRPDDTGASRAPLLVSDKESDMESLTARQLSRETSEVLDRVERGETLEIKRGKRTIAKLVPVAPEPTKAEMKRFWEENE